MSSKLMIDIGSTYFKVAQEGEIEQYFRDFNKNIFDDLSSKCASLIEQYSEENIHICSSANGGLSTLIIGLTNSFSLKYAINIAFNSGINIIDTVLYPKIEQEPVPTEMIDVVIIVGGIDSVENVFDEKLLDYLDRVNYQNIVYVGTKKSTPFLQENIENIVVLENVISDKLKIQEEALKTYLTDLYQADIMGKEDIKQLYGITTNQIFSTPYIVNRSLSEISEHMDVADPFIVVDIGGATTDIHYSRDLVNDNILTDSGYDRLVFKKLGVFKSRESLVHTAKNNEFVFELLEHLNVTENILEEYSEKATRTLMQLAIFLVLYKVSKHHASYIELNLEILNSIVLTGGITKVLTQEEVDDIILFFYKKILHFHHAPKILLDQNYEIWTYGITGSSLKE
ncbi:methylaspartate mutase [Sulfurovum lithotrophicum]|uniref:Methylaspartate mutase n=1 Tax=Sulfurovum lithotrophicum TaxID=206403 RepID=A0A7U4M0P4_9BACT|nr:glutamate mutase L [Sulfurovum lithotrophicum]AKF24706.1 methylaspartate mutase [Sulfurovum lithotrophicum]